VRLSNESVASAATSNEYEIVSMSAETGSGNDEVDLKIVGNGNEAELQEKLLECMAETPEQNQPRSLEHQFEMVNIMKLIPVANTYHC
jgi:hypothetical protein